MSKIVFYVAILIGIYLILSHNNSTSILSSGGSALNGFVGTLQGRSVSGGGGVSVGGNQGVV